MALAEPDVAVIVAVPFLTAVTRPDDDTVATDEFDVAHVTDAPDIVAPFWSLTVAVSCCVTPTDEKDRLVTDSVIEVATGVGGAGGVGGVVGELPLSPHAVISRRATKYRTFCLIISPLPEVLFAGKVRCEQVHPQLRGQWTEERDY